ncbi:MAG: hypothetical protein ACRDSP_24935 [Pseudonocardiaceae bacterium]
MRLRSASREHFLVALAAFADLAAPDTLELPDAAPDPHTARRRPRPLLRARARKNCGGSSRSPARGQRKIALARWVRNRRLSDARHARWSKSTAPSTTTAPQAWPSVWVTRSVSPWSAPRCSPHFLLVRSSLLGASLPCGVTG